VCCNEFVGKEAVRGVYKGDVATVVFARHESILFAASGSCRILGRSLKLQSALVGKEWVKFKTAALLGGYSVGPQV
jgi:hypothetical protein